MKSIRANFGKDEVNYALDMVSLNDLNKDETDFEKLVREKSNLENRLREAL